MARQKKKANFPKLRAFLKEKGVNASTSTSEIHALKKEYERAYNRWYHKERRKQKQHRFTLRLSQKEYERLVRHATKLEKKNLSDFIKEAAFTHLDQHYVRFDKKILIEHKQELRKIGNNVNQVVQSIHRMVRRKNLAGQVEDAQLYEVLQLNYQQIIQDLVQLQNEFSRFMEELEKKPPLRIDEALFLMLQDKPEKIIQLQKILSDFNT